MDLVTTTPDTTADRVAPRHLDRDELAAGLDEIRAAPRDDGVLELIVRRPAEDAREVLDAAELSLTYGVEGDNWIARGSSRTADGSSHPDMQLNVINARVSRLVAGDADVQRALAGDQLHVDLDLSHDNLPAGTRLAFGDGDPGDGNTPVIEVTEQPHTGCAKFAARFGRDALRFVNVGEGAALRMRGLNAKVVVPGTIRRGDLIRKVT